MIEIFQGLWTSMAFDNLYWGNILMWAIALTFIYLAIKKGFEPLLFLLFASISLRSRNKFWAGIMS